MNSAVAALQSQSTALSTVSNNLANSSTTGYKAVSTQFISLLSQPSAANTNPAGGVLAVARQNLQLGGQVQTTTTTTDMAITGNGLFPVTNGLTGLETLYTRDGAFNADAQGNLMLSGTNFYLKGWPTDTNGNITASNAANVASLVPVNINSLSSSAVATTTYSINANIPADAQPSVVTTTSQVSYPAADGTSMSTPITWTPTGSNSYTLTVGTPTGTDNPTLNDSTGAAVTSYSYDVVLNPDNSFQSVTPIGNAPVDTTSMPGFTLPVVNASDLAAPMDLYDTPSVGAVDATGAAVTATGPLSPTMPTPFSQTITCSVVDSLGSEQSIPVTFIAGGNNTWQMSVGLPTSADGKTVTGALAGGAKSYSYSVTFDGNGALASITPQSPNAPALVGSNPMLDIASWTDNASPSTISFNIGTIGKSDGLQQLGSQLSSPAISTNTTSQDGVRAGQVTGVSIDASGNVIANYNNGQQATIYKVPLATFANEEGLSALSGGVYEETKQSGTYSLNTAGSNGAGTITGEALEASNVNTSGEFSNMISAQQAYSAASQIIGTDKKMFDSLLQVIQ